MSLDLDELYSSFLQTSKDILNHAEELILKLEVSYEHDAVEDLFRGIHTIKGNSGIFDLPLVDKVAHVFEDYLSDLRNDANMFDKKMIDPMLTGVDILCRMIVDQEEFNDSKINEVILGFRSNNMQESEKIAQEEKVESLTDTTAFTNNKEKVNNTKYKIPRKAVENAKKNNLFLYFTLLDIKFQQFESFLDFQNALTSFVNDLDNVSKALIYLENGSNSINSTIAVLGTSKNSIVQNNEYGLTFKAFKCVHSPKSESVISSTSQESEVAKNDDQKNIVHEKISVKIDTLDKLVQIMRETVLTRNQLLRKATLVEDNSLDADIKKIGSQISELQEIILQTRLQDINIIFARIPRLMRDTAQQLGKKIDLQIKSANVELDKSILDKITDPIVHIVRNAIDHGIESPEVRKESGKNEEGKFWITASLNEGHVEILFKDDGAGLNYEKIRKKIVEKKLISKIEAQKLSKEQLIDYIFRAGFSTAAAVTSISGRGVGLDAVRKELEAINGTIIANSEESKGTEFLLKIPQSISILSCYISVVNGKNIAIQEKLILETVINNSENITLVEGKPVYRFRGSLLPLVHFNHVVQAKTTSLKLEELITYEYICIVQTEYFTYGILINKFKEQEELVIKPVNVKYLKNVEYLAGSGVLGDGSVALFLDLNRLAERANLEKSEMIRTDDEKHNFTEADLINYVIFEYSSEYFAFSFSEVSRIVELDVEKIGQVLGKPAIKENDTMVPLIDLSYSLKVKSNEENRKSVILLKNPNGVAKGISVDSIVNFSSDITSLQKGEHSSSLIKGQGFYEKKPIVILDSTKISEANF